MISEFAELLACPACGGTLTPAWRCSGCGALYETADGIPNLRVASDSRTEVVRDFYAQAPFPGYPPCHSLEWLRARAARSEFARLLDAAIAPDARVVDLGCGTGQMALYLARGSRLVVGADLTRASLQLGMAAARQYAVDRVQFVETDLHRPGLRKGSFDVVYSSGVLHHTPNPRAAFACVTQLAKTGGMIVVGVYNSFARIPFRLRRLFGRVSDSVLRDRENQLGRRQAWVRDQYQHPEEHRHTLAEVQGWFAENRVEYVRTYPSAMLETESEELFASHADNWRLEGWMAQLGWIRALGHEGGLFVTVGRRT